MVEKGCIGRKWVNLISISEFCVNRNFRGILVNIQFFAGPEFVVQQQVVSSNQAAPYFLQIMLTLANFAKPSSKSDKD